MKEVNNHGKDEVLKLVPFLLLKRTPKLFLVCQFVCLLVFALHREDASTCIFSLAEKEAVQRGEYFVKREIILGKS